MKIDLPLGDVVDRASILRIKEARIEEGAALEHVRRELAELERAWAVEGHDPFEELDQWDELSRINRRLWDVENALRDHERHGDFGARFVEMARHVYHLNDRRAALKREINEQLGSRLVEQKSYPEYSDA